MNTLLEEGHSPDDAGGIVLLHLMAVSEDTCLISRAAHETWKRLLERLKQTLSVEPRPNLDFRRALDEEFIWHNWSAGRCADLLAICWLLRFMEAESMAAVPETSLGPEE